VAEQAGLSFLSAFAAPECRRPFPQVTAQAERAKLSPAASGVLSSVGIRRRLCLRPPRPDRAESRC